MSTYSTSPRLLKGGLVVLDPVSRAVLRVIALQYNPDTLTRTLQPKGMGTESGDRSEALRLRGPPVETIKLEAEIDATARELSTGAFGIQPELATLETLVYPSVEQLLQNLFLAQRGTLEIAPMQAPLTLFVWGSTRIVPVRITEFSVTEEAFDAGLNPIRAKVSLGLRVLSVDDLGFEHRGGGFFLTYHTWKQAFASLNPPGSFEALGTPGV